ncbi:MAG: hypothetical protein A2177_08655 [Spirochaetes bacterium RBG_13_68_11]|nr:MAG: hypothetical protein A2177_08655 [Spirochaetes bacterium RBG_13_68_11]
MAMAERKPFLLRIDSDLYTALARWADDELRSLNGQIEFLLHRILEDVGRLPTSGYSRALTPRPAARKPSGAHARVRQSTSASSRALAPRSAPRKPAGTRAQGRVPTPVSPRTPAPQPAAQKPVDETPPARRPDDDWDAMVD